MEKHGNYCSIVGLHWDYISLEASGFRIRPDPG